MSVTSASKPPPLPPRNGPLPPLSTDHHTLPVTPTHGSLPSLPPGHKNLPPLPLHHNGAREAGDSGRALSQGQEVSPHRATRHHAATIPSPHHGTVTCFESHDHGSVATDRSHDHGSVATDRSHDRSHNHGSVATDRSNDRGCVAKSHCTPASHNHDVLLYGRSASTQADTPPPPPPPRRAASLPVQHEHLNTDLEGRFSFQAVSTLPAPDEFSMSKKNYPSLIKRAARKDAQRAPSSPPPPPAPL